MRYQLTDPANPLPVVALDSGFVHSFLSALRQGRYNGLFEISPQLAQLASFVIAVSVFGNEFRKDGTPAMGHTERVAEPFKNAGNNLDADHAALVVIANLHDVI